MSGEGDLAFWDELLATNSLADVPAAPAADPATTLEQSAYAPDAMDIDVAQPAVTQARAQVGMKRRLTQDDAADDVEIDEDDDEDDDEEDDGNDHDRDPEQDGNDDEEDNQEEDIDDEGAERERTFTGRALGKDVDLPRRPPRKRARLAVDHLERIQKLTRLETAPQLPLQLPSHTQDLAELNKHFPVKAVALPKASSTKTPFNSTLDLPLVIQHIPTKPYSFRDPRGRIAMSSPISEVNASNAEGGVKGSERKAPIRVVPEWFRPDSISQIEKLAFEIHANPSSNDLTTLPDNAYTENMYLKLRNGIVDLYNSNSATPLSLSKWYPSLPLEVNPLFDIVQCFIILLV